MEVWATPSTQAPAGGACAGQTACRIGDPLVGHALGIAALAFSPDGRMLATGSYDGSVRLWDLTDPAKPIPPAQSLTGRAGGVEQVAFSPAWQGLDTRGEDSATRRWDMNVDHAIDRICRHPQDTHAPRRGAVASATSLAAIRRAHDPAVWCPGKVTVFTQR
ncbi:hypothetical protein [Streptomyces sp. NPDC045369]|uniref:WD40 repeat domain-containing protein n=1 Tax=Streptomyces sp. NPDC045369 TaxID=3155732 RepID=UPI0033E1A6CE